MFSIYRSRSRILAGVAGGIADRIGVNRNLLRIVWLISVPFTWFVSAAVYVVAALVLPVAPEGIETRPASGLGRQALALFVGAHGLVHTIGFLTAWRLPVPEGFVYSTTAFWGRVDLTDGGVKLFGLVWLAVAVAYLVAAAMLWAVTRRSVAVTVLVSAASAPLCALFSPQAVAGLAIDVVLIAGLPLASRLMPALRAPALRSARAR